METISYTDFLESYNNSLMDRLIEAHKKIGGLQFHLENLEKENEKLKNCKIIRFESAPSKETKFRVTNNKL